MLQVRQSSEIDLVMAGKEVANPLLLQQKKNSKVEQQSFKSGNYDTLKAGTASEATKLIPTEKDEKTASQRVSPSPQTSTRPQLEKVLKQPEVKMTGSSFNRRLT